MQPVSTSSADSSCANQHAPDFPPLQFVNRPTLTTEQAAFYLNRRPQTLRIWAMRDGYGPIRPVRVHGRLAWPIAEIRRLLGVNHA